MQNTNHTSQTGLIPNGEDLAHAQITHGSCRPGGIRIDTGDTRLLRYGVGRRRSRHLEMPGVRNKQGSARAGVLKASLPQTPQQAVVRRRVAFRGNGSIECLIIAFPKVRPPFRTAERDQRTGSAFHAGQCLTRCGFDRCQTR